MFKNYSYISDKPKNIIQTTNNSAALVDAVEKEINDLQSSQKPQFALAQR